MIEKRIVKIQYREWFIKKEIENTELWWVCPRCKFESKDPGLGTMHALDHLLME